MNIFRKYTLRTLRKNKVRTIVTIVGIILSVSMFTAVTTLVSSLHAFMRDTIIATEGDWHVAALSVDGEKREALLGDEKVSAAYALENIGYARLSNCANSDKPYLFVAGMDDSFMSKMPISITSGRMPENNGEIILPDHLADNGGVVYQIGETLTLVLGDRTLSGQTLTQSNQYENEEYGAEAFEPKESRTYTVVGTYARPSFEDWSAPGYTALTVMDESAAAATYDVYLKLDSPYDSESFLENELSGCAATMNADLLRVYGASGETSYTNVITSLAAVLAAIIFAASISLIYNAFSISVGERTRQFGLLSSIGATKRQLRKSVMFEALALCIVGIPLGLIFGMLGIGVTLKLLWPSFEYMLGNATSVTLQLVPSFAALLIAAALGALTVLISAFIPAKRATSMPAIEAIRQTADVNIRKRDVRTSKLTYALFGFPGMIARKNFKRSRRRYRATVISLFLSVVLFISASSFCAYLQRGVEDVMGVQDYDISYSLFDSDTSPDTMMAALSGAAGVEESSYLAIQTKTLDVPVSELSKEYREYLEKNDGLEDGSETYGISAIVVYADQATYDQLAKKSGLDASSGAGLVVNSQKLYNGSEERYYVLSVLESCAGTLGSSEDSEQYAFSGETESGPLGTGGYDTFMLIYPYSRLEEQQSSDNSGTMFFFKVKNHTVAADQMSARLKAASLPTEQLYDQAEQADTNRAVITVINVFSYGFIILISLIAAANVFNTISTNIGLRRREFAMLRSIGMTNREFSRMMNYECLMYGLKGLIYGLPAAVLVTWVIFKSVSQGLATGFFIPWQSVAVAAGSVFAVVFATMLYSTHKLKGENTADALKNENL